MEERRKKEWKAKKEKKQAQTLAKVEAPEKRNLILYEIRNYPL